MKLVNSSTELGIFIQILLKYRFLVGLHSHREISCLSVPVSLALR